MSTNSEDGPGNDCLSQAEAARLLGVSRQAVHKLIRSGRLRPVQFGDRIFVNRADLEAMGRLEPGRPRRGQPNAISRLIAMIDGLSPVQQQDILEHLRTRHPHPIEAELGAPSVLILEAVRLSGDLTKRMLKGVIAEGAFRLYVLDELNGWSFRDTPAGQPYDFLLEDEQEDVKVQVKLQRSEQGAAVVTTSGHYIAETQRTRGGQKRGSGEKTRPYHYGDFHILAVSIKPATGRWTDFRYTVADWLLPKPGSQTEMAVLQPVSSSPDDSWTDSFEECVTWLRSGEQRRVTGQLSKRRKAEGADPNS